MAHTDSTPAASPAQAIWLTCHATHSCRSCQGTIPAGQHTAYLRGTGEHLCILCATLPPDPHEWRHFVASSPDWAEATSFDIPPYDLAADL